MLKSITGKLGDARSWSPFKTNSAIFSWLLTSLTDWTRFVRRHRNILREILAAVFSTSHWELLTSIVPPHNTSLCYGSVSGAYRFLPVPCLGVSYHKSVYLLPLYKPAFRCLEGWNEGVRAVKTWSEDSISSLQACFHCTDWQRFYDRGNIDDLTQTVPSCVTLCGFDHLHQKSGYLSE